MHDVGRVQGSGAKRHTGNGVRRLVALVVTLGTALTGVVVGLTGATVQAAQPISTFCADGFLTEGEVACATSPLTLTMSPTQVSVGSTTTYTFDAAVSSAASLPQPTPFAFFIPAALTRPQLTTSTAAGFVSVVAASPCASATLTGVTGGGSRPWRVAGVAEGCGGQFGVRLTYAGVAPTRPSSLRFWISTALTGNVRLGSNASTVETVAGPPARLAVSMDATSKSAGSDWTPTVWVVDSFGNPTPAGGSLTLVTDDPRSSQSVHTLRDGSAVLPDSVRLVTAGTRRITAVLQPGGLTGSVTVRVTPGAVDSIRLTAPSVLVDRAPTGSISVADVHGNRVTGYEGVISLSLSGPAGSAASSVPFTAADRGVKQIGELLAPLTGVVGPLQVRASIDGTSIAAERTVVVRPGTAVRFEVTGLVEGVEGLPQTITVTARDAAGNVATGYRGPVIFSSTDPSAVLPAEATLSSGRRTFSRIVVFDPQRMVIPTVVLNTGGQQTITVSDITEPSITGSQTVNVIDTSGVVGFAVTGLRDAVAGTRQSIEVRAIDAQGNRVTGYTGTVTFTSNDPTASLPAPVTFTPTDRGIRTVNVTLRSAGPRTVTVGDSAIPGSATNNSVVVTAGAATRLSISRLDPGGNRTVGPRTVTVTALDTHGNVATSYRGTVGFEILGTEVDELAPYTFTAADAGRREFDVTLTRPSSGSGARLTVVDTSSHQLSVTTPAITLRAGPVADLVVETPFVQDRTGGIGVITSYRPLTGAYTGLRYDIRVVGHDAYGNVVPTSPTGTLSFTSSDPQALLPGSMRSLTSANGSVTFRTIGRQTLTLTFAGTDPAVGTITKVVPVQVDGPVQSMQLQLPAAVSPGVPFSATVTLHHADGSLHHGVLSPRLRFWSDDPEFSLGGGSGRTAPEVDYRVVDGTFSVEGLTLVRPGTTRIRVGFVGVEDDVPFDGLVSFGDEATVEVSRLGDTFARAIPISGESGSTVLNDAQLVNGRSAWLRWTAPTTGTVTFHTCETDRVTAAADRTIAISTGSTLQTLTPVTVDAGRCASGAAIATFPATAGEVYTIRLASTTASGSDPFTLTWGGSPSNDSFEAATAITGVEGSIDGSNIGATSQPDEPVEPATPQDRAAADTVWYRWVAPETYAVQFDVCGFLGFEAELAVYTGTGLADLQTVLMTNDACGDASSVRFGAAVGTEYWIRVDGVDATQGEFVLNWSRASSNDSFDSAITLVGFGGSIPGSNVGATSEPDEPVGTATPEAADTVWYRWVAEFGFPVGFDVCGVAGFQGTVTVYTGSELSDLQQVAGGTGSCGVPPAVQFQADWQTEYWIQVDGVGATQGQFELIWEVGFPEDVP